jgi:hypothetical protein
MKNLVLALATLALSVPALAQETAHAAATASATAASVIAIQLLQQNGTLLANMFAK